MKYGQGVLLMRALRYYLNTRQVFDLAVDTPIDCLRQFTQVEHLRILCCGGDGTVGWILSVLDQLESEFVMRPVIAVLPLGTGNDLARSLNFGGGYEGEKIPALLSLYQTAEPVLFDRWSFKLTSTGTSGGDSDPVPLTVVNNYYSVGVDASIAYRFHHERIKNPERFTNRLKNKVLYGQYGAAEAFSSTYKNLDREVDLVVDGTQIVLPKLEGLAVINIPSMYGGTNLWGDTKSRRFVQQRLGDGLIEVVGIYGSVHVAQIKGHMRQSAKRLAQGKVIEITTRAKYPMQVDGEPWMQAACHIRIERQTQALLMMNDSKKKKSSNTSISSTTSSSSPEPSTAK